MLADDVNRLKSCIKAKNWDVLSTGDRGDDRKWLINLSRQFFLKKGDFVDDRTGQVVEREYIDYNYSIGEVIEIIKENRSEILKGW